MARVTISKDQVMCHDSKDNPIYHTYDPISVNSELFGEDRIPPTEQKHLYSYFMDSSLVTTSEKSYPRYLHRIYQYLLMHFYAHFISSNMILKSLTHLNLYTFGTTSFSFIVTNIRKIQVTQTFSEKQQKCFKQLSETPETFQGISARLRYFEEKLGLCIHRILKQYTDIPFHAQSLHAVASQISLTEPISAVQIFSIFKYLEKTGYFLKDMKYFLQNFTFDDLSDDLEPVITPYENSQLLNCMFQYSLWRFLMEFDLKLSFDQCLNLYYMDPFIISILPPTTKPLQTIYLSYKPEILKLINSVFVLMVRNHFISKQSSLSDFSHSKNFGS